ncbi:hypothetical protein [Chitinophaga nivalis]|uniref:Uncharacterized protein n=1 Tax=Chitinophaga nivalis TaxID=2991709 RepID=A0ABT3IP37_9BACT|nr:hypothetical protein [Chitinophaga nivalis]MCW3464574.1 hypothetical protein [Chitinophaga nivalis]MCW3485735.1 hypothetical protein [Chitinophaga nivalis]
MPELKFITTDKNSGFPEYLDFATLRKAGIQHIADFSGKIWTDHNLHDPGITMLEALCYVLTDLDYRTRLDFKDLVAAPATEEDTGENFFTAAQILGNNPLTITDIRKILIDIKGVRNAWLELPQKGEYTLSWNCEAGKLQNLPPTGTHDTPVPLKGLYKVCIEPDDVYAAAYEKDACGNDVFPIDKILTTIKERLHQHRNLCEDFAEIKVLPKELISLCLHVELKANFDPEDVLVNIYSKIQDYFSPAPAFYTLQELLEKGRTMEEIFEGRPYDFKGNKALQQNGFIDTKELENLQRITEIHASDLYRIIMTVDGVAGITRLLMKDADEDSFEQIDINDVPIPNDGEEWCLKLKDFHRPVLSPELSNVIFYRNNVPFTADLQKVKQRYVKAISDYNKSPKSNTALDTVIPEGRQLNLAQYNSVQYEFPQVYLVGKNEVPTKATAARKAQSLQLQAYLLFYDRLLADYFAQLANIRKLFSLGKITPATQQTYFAADISHVPQLPALLRYEKKLPVTTAGNVAPGARLAYEPAPDGSGRKTYPSLFQRDEAIRRITKACNNNTVKRIVEQQEDSGNWYLQLTDMAGDLLLEGAIYFESEQLAQQAVRDIIFLAGLEGSYSRINNREEDEYSFDVIYNNTGYTEMLAALYETAEEYNERKEKFQNHLLARFAEDFTDYALMMYNISGKQNDPARNIADKAAFLATYPETSANRAKAFDHTQPAAGFPVCGLQQRMAGLMGIRQEPAASLNNFDLVQAVRQKAFACSLPGLNTPLFISTSLYEETEFETVTTLFREIAAAKHNYRPYGCPGEGVFGFTVRSPQDSEIWIEAKCTIECNQAADRDALIDWLVKFFEDNGQYKLITRSQEGHYFLLPDDKGNTLLKSTVGYDTDIAALDAGYDCLDILQDGQAWEIRYDATAANYSIVILDTRQQPVVLLAKHPRNFNSKADADKALIQLQQYFRKKYLVYTREYTTVHSWQTLEQELPAWVSAFTFNDRTQLPVNWSSFVELAADAANYKWRKDAEEIYHLEVVRTTAEPDAQPLVMATHVAGYASLAAVQDAVAYYVGLFNRLWMTVSRTPEAVTAAWYIFQDIDGCEGAGETVLTTLQPVPDGPEVAPFTRSIIRYAADPQNLSVNYSVTDTASCLYVVQLRSPEGILLAESPAVATREEAIRLLEKIQQKAAADELWCVKGNTATVYRFVWKEERSCTALLQSTDVWHTAGEVAHALLQALSHPDGLHLEPVYKQGNGYGYTVYAGKRRFARQVKWYETAAERDAIIQLIKEEWRLLTANIVWMTTTTEHYYFKIKEASGWLLLEEPRYYNSLHEVRTAFYNTVKFGKKREYYQLYDQHQCTYGFQIVDDAGVVIAVHPREYVTEEEREIAIVRVMRFLQDHGQVVSQLKMPGAWRYSWEWLSCAFRPETALEGLEDQQDDEAATAALKELLDLAAKGKDSFKVEGEGEEFRIFLTNGAVRVALHPRIFSTRGQAEITTDRLVAWAKYQLEKAFLKRDITFNGRLLTPADGTSIKSIGYRLWDRTFRMARYCPLFDKEDKRAAALEEMLLHYQRKAPVYTLIERGNAAIVEQNRQYYYQLRGNRLVLWQSIAAYPDAATAMTAFEKDVWGLLELSADNTHYSEWQEGAGYLYLLDKKGNQVASYKEDFESYDHYIAAIRARLRFAKSHGIYLRNNGEYAFRIYNTTAGRCDWDSVHTYPDPEQAIKALREFLRLLRYRGNYCLDEKNETGHYPITLGRVLLDLQRVTKECDNTATQDTAEPEVPPQDEAWNRLQSFLDSLEPGADMFFPYTDYKDECRYTFRLIDKNIYRVARHASWYQSMEKREAARLQLLADIVCKKRLYGWYVQPTKPATQELLGAYFEHPERVNATDLWWSFAKEQISWKQVSETLSGNITLYYYQLIGKNSKVVWESVNRYASAALAQKEQQYFYVYLLEMARAATAYHYEPVLGKKDTYRLSLKDIDGNIIAIAPECITADILENDQATRICNAIMYPVMQNGDGYTFEINNVIQEQEGNKSTYTYTTIWDAIQLYETPDLAFEALKGVCGQLLPDLQQYERGDEDACGPFGIVLTDPNGLLATHPFSYTSMKARKAAMDLVESAISAEGFHLLEHILLRPGEQGTGCTTGEEGVLQTCVDECLCDCDNQPADLTKQEDPLCNTIFKADPYSFRATVVLPGWPQRFRLARFRQFFEDNLRKEAPAHIRLNIVWIGAKQMSQFEKAWQQWLSALSRDNSCDYTDSLQQLNKIILALENIYPAAYLYDDEGGGDRPLIMLDETMLG